MQRGKVGAPWGHLLAGASAGVVSKTVTSPLNVISMKMMIAQRSAGTAATGIGTVMTSVMESAGWQGFFQGNLSNVCKSAPSKAIDFFAYDIFKKLITGGKKEPTDMQRLAAGAMAGATSTTMMYPLEVVSSRFVMNKGAYKSIPDAMATIARTEGPKALYSGLGPSLVGIVPYAGISYGMFDILRRAYMKSAKVEKPSVGTNLAIGVLSGWTAMMVSFPLEVTRRRLQVQGMAGQPKRYKGMMDAFKKIAKEEGLSTFYAGWQPATLKLAPAAAVSFATYQLVKDLISSVQEKAEAKRREEDAMWPLH